MKNKKIKIGLIVIGAVIVGILFWPRKFADINYAHRETLLAYVNKLGGYQVSVPKGWIPNVATPSANLSNRISWQPGSQGVELGNIGMISITIVASPSATQELSSVSEFNKWWSAPTQTATNTDIIKIENGKVAGFDSIRLGQMDLVAENPESSFWSVTDWFRKGEVNYYVNMLGNGNLTSVEFDWFNRILNSIGWIN